LQEGDGMTTPINVDVQAMVNAAQEMMDKHGSIASQISTLQQQLDGLAGSWKGESANVFNQAFNGFYEDCNTVLTTLQNLASNVDTAARTYESTHQMNTSDAQALANRIQSTAAGLPGF